MRRYKIVDYDRFRRFAKMFMMLFLIVFSILFIRVINTNNGLRPQTVEYHTYEIVQVPSPDNHRVKTPAIREVVYKTVYR